MKHARYSAILAIIFILAGCGNKQPAGTITISRLFTDHMILQREMPLPVWGTASAGGVVTIELDGQSVTTHADLAGNWKAILKPQAAGGPYELKIMGVDTLVINDVLIGEVWIGSGQSNMEMPLKGWGKIDNFEQEIANANYPEIRLFTVPRRIEFEPVHDLQAEGWEVCTPATIPEFSAMAYFYGRTLHQELNVPVGLIHSSWGGTIVETWTSAAALNQFPDYRNKIARLKQVKRPAGEAGEQEGWEVATYNATWQEEVRHRDPGLPLSESRWAEPDFDCSDWPVMDLPALWEDRGMPTLDGIVWFRKAVELPVDWAGQEITLRLSSVDDIDSTYFNGHFVGTHNVWNEPREYTVPSELVKAGRNVITVRVEDDQGGGGIWADPDLLRLDLPATESLSLVGDWHYKVVVDFSDMETSYINPGMPNFPTLLSNAMIEPLIPYAIRGAIWYQGEANVNQAYRYRTLFPMMITDWRQRWGQGDFPFLFVQLAAFMERAAQPDEHAWAELREAQFQTLNLPNTGMAVAIDIGDAADIHPKNKQEVGKRLALNALEQVYGQAVIGSGPLYQGYQIRDGKVIIDFDYAERLKTLPEGSELQGFAITGADKIFHWATARIEGEKVVVESPEVRNPVAVRYGWDCNPAVNLYNGAGLPASPFRTDDWPGLTWARE